MGALSRIGHILLGSAPVPALSMEDTTEAGVLRQQMRLIVDHPVIRFFPYLAILAPMVACILVLIISQSPGLAVGLALLLYAQLSARSSGFLLRSIWATTTIALRNAVNSGRMSTAEQDDVDLVNKTSRALKQYAFALAYLNPALNVTAALIVLVISFAPWAGSLPISLAAVILVAITLSVCLAFIPNRIFLRLANRILAKSKESS